MKSTLEIATKTMLTWLMEQNKPRVACVVDGDAGVSVSTWLSPKSAKWCHKNLPDSTKKFITNFQLKFAKRSKILPNNLLCVKCIK